MLMRIAPAPSPADPKPAGVWVNTDHIVSAREVRRTEPNDEPLEFVIKLVSGEQFPINVHWAGRGTAERFFLWLEGQEKLPKIETPKAIDKGGKGKSPVLQGSLQGVGQS